MVVGWPIASTISGRLIPRLGFRPLIRIGLAISALAAIGLAYLLKPGASLLIAPIATSLFGVGLGLANTALLIAVQTSVDWAQRGVATASTIFARTVGGALAIGGMGAVLSSAFARDPSVPPDAANLLLAPDHGASLSPVILQRLAGILEGSLGTIFWMIFGLAAAAFIASWWFPAVPLSGPAQPDKGVRLPALEEVS
jgi:hypothetical protein